MQNSDPLEETANIKFIQQLFKFNITFTDNDIKNWMNCDGPGYKHMD